VASAKVGSAAPGTIDSEDIFQRTNLSPRMTGLPMSVWVSPRGNARHDVRVKVNMTHGNNMSADNTAVVAVPPSPRVVAGRLASEDEHAVANWITLNSAAIIAYWDGSIDTGQLIETLKLLPST
jgi:hypothetical protein